MKKGALSILFVGLFLVVFINLVLSLNINQLNGTECENAGASWSYLSPENSDSRFECVCNEYAGGKQTKMWDGVNCLTIAEEIKCEKTEGQWMNGECICEDGKWIKDVGCQFIEHEDNYLKTFLMVLGVLIIILLILIIHLNLRKK